MELCHASPAVTRNGIHCDEGQICLAQRQRQGPIAELSIYLSMRADRNAGDLHLDGTCTETSRLSRSLNFAIAERIIIAKPVGPDSIIGY